MNLRKNDRKETAYQQPRHSSSTVGQGLTNAVQKFDCTKIRHQINSSFNLSIYQSPNLPMLALITNMCCIFPCQFHCISVRACTMCRWIELHGTLGCASATTSASATPRLFSGLDHCFLHRPRLLGLLSALLSSLRRLTHALLLLIGGDFEEVAVGGHDGG